MKLRELNKTEYNQKIENNVELKSHEFYLEDLKSLVIYFVKNIIYLLFLKRKS